MDALHVERGLIEIGAEGVKFTPMPLPPAAEGIPPALIEALGGQGAFEALPILDLPARAGGGTGYIDWVRPSDMSAPIMRGTDGYGRPFVAVRYEVDGAEGAEVEVLFRRYTSGDVWVSGGNNVLCTSAFSPADAEYLGRLVRGEKVGRRDWWPALHEEGSVKIV